ncbi:MAG: GGDEF domain-containing protein [Clostridia bacterium]
MRISLQTEVLILGDQTQKNKIFIAIISVLIIAILGVSVLFIKDMNALNDAYLDLHNIEYISSSTQRLVNLAQNNQLMQRDVFSIDESTKNALEVGQSETLSVLTDMYMLSLSREVISSWNTLEVIFQEVIEGNTADIGELSIARDKHFSAMTDITNEITSHTSELNQSISQYQAMIFVLFFAVAIVMLNNIMRTHTELQHSKALAQTAQIDTATGLYNRSKCQELFKNYTSSSSNKKRPAILVMDLNDLKKTNDTLGHRVGDELIQGFANVLKNASDALVTPPFIGRYGGDEFIVYYEDILNEGEIKIYLKELAFLTQEANNDEVRFQISYAVGYAYQSDNTSDQLTTRQLFDKADEAMYVDKESKKRAKNPDYDKEVDAR